MAVSSRQLNPELHQWLDARQESLTIVKTTKTPSGHILDWVPVKSQVPGGKIAAPPPARFLPSRTEDKHHPVKAVSFELDDPAVERGPKGTVPVLRPDLSRLTRTVSLKDYGRKPGGLLVNKDRPNKKPTDPDPAGYFHDVDSQTTLERWCPATARRRKTRRRAAPPIPTRFECTCAAYTFGTAISTRVARRRETSGRRNPKKRLST
jgi:hypothetical protein